VPYQTNTQSILLFKEEVIEEEKESNQFAKDSAVTTHAVSFKDVAGTSQLSFVLLVIRGFSMTKKACRFAANLKLLLLLLSLEDRTIIMEDLLMVVEESEEKERDEAEALCHF